MGAMRFILEGGVVAKSFLSLSALAHKYHS
jgi:hypothetical protein